MAILHAPENNQSIKGGAFYELIDGHGLKRFQRLLGKLRRQSSPQDNLQYLKNNHTGGLELTRLNFTQQATSEFENIIDCLDYLEVVSYQRQQEVYTASIVACGFDMTASNIIDYLTGYDTGSSSNEYSIYCRLIYDFNYLVCQELLSRNLDSGSLHSTALNHGLDQDYLTPYNIHQFNLEVLDNFVVNS